LKTNLYLAFLHTFTMIVNHILHFLILINNLLVQINEFFVNFIL